MSRRHQDINKMTQEKQNAYTIETAVRIARADEQKGLGLQGLLILCTVFRLGRPPVRAIAKSVGIGISSISARCTQLTKEGYLIMEEDDIYLVNHYSVSEKGAALFAPNKLQILGE